MNNSGNEFCIAKCNKTGKLILMEFDEEEGEWICLHKETREEEIEDISRIINKFI